MTWRTNELPVALAAVLVTVVVVAIDPRTPVPPFLPIGDYASYDARTPAVVAIVEPVIHAPWRGMPSALAASAAAALVSLSFWTACRMSGAGPAATAVALAAFVSRPDLRALVAAAAPGMLAIACLWAALMALRLPAPVWRAALWGAVLWAAALALWPPLVIAVPVVLAAAMSGGGVRAATVGMAGVAGVAAGVWLWADAATVISGEGVTALDVWRVVWNADPRGSDPFVWPPNAAARLPVALVGAGAAAWLGRASRSWLVAGGAVVTAALAALAPTAWHAETSRAVYWSAWPLVALGLSWLTAYAPSGGRATVIAAMALVLVGGGVSASIREVEAIEPRAFAVSLSETARAIQRETPRAVFVAEDTRVDTALVAAAGRDLARVRPLPLLVEQHAENGALVLAAPQARMALELWGLRFVERFVVTAPVRLPFAARTGRLRCLPLANPWRELPGLEYTARLGVHLPPGQGRFEAVVISPPPSVIALTSPTGQPRGRITPVTMELDDLPAVLWPGGDQMPDPASVATRIQLDASPTFHISTSLNLGARAPAVAVRFVDDARSTGVATVCAAPLPREDPVGETSTGFIALDDPALFAGGWHAPEGTGRDAFRWTTRRAVMLVPSTASRDVTLAIDARAATPDTNGPVTLTAVVNGWPAGVRAMTGSGPTYEWRVPSSIWVDGTNEIAFEVSHTVRPSDSGGHDTRELGAAVTRIRLRRQD